MPNHGIILAQFGEKGKLAHGGLTDLPNDVILDADNELQ